MKNFWVRFGTSTLLILFVASFLVMSYFVHSVFLDLLILAFALTALYEISKSFKLGGYNVYNIPMFLFGITVYPLFYVFEHLVSITTTNTYIFQGAIGILISFALSSLVALVMFTFKKEGELKDLVATIFAMFYPMLILSFGFIVSNRFFGIYGVLFAVFMPIMCDVFAYLAGSTIGGKKLCPSISPKKTIAGAVGGLFGAMIASVLMFIFFEVLPFYGIYQGGTFGYIPFANALWKSALIYLTIGFLGGIVAQIGDITASRIKRAIGIKDFGKIFPGHGGALDRLDSIMFDLMFLFVAFSIIYIF